jgi:hypothetical protein
MVVLVTALVSKIIITTSYFIARVFCPKDQADDDDSINKRIEIRIKCGSDRDIGQMTCETKL